MNYIDFFLKNNKSGAKTKESLLSTSHPEIYAQILNFTKNNNDLPFIEKIYLFINKLDSPPKCKTCGNKTNFFGSLNKGYGTYCSVICMNRNIDRKQEIVNGYQEKYGVDSHNKLQQIKDQKAKTTMKKYGVSNAMMLPKTQKKYKETMLMRYGVDNPMKIPSIADAFSKRIESGEETNVARMLNRVDINQYIFIKHEQNNTTFIHRKCSHEFTINSNLLNSRINIVELCLFCNPLKSYSTTEKKIESILIENHISYIQNDRTLLNGKEIDLYIKDKKVGIEINGLYWHSDKFHIMDDMYHINKTNIARTKGVNLLHFYEDEINEKFEIVKSIILNKLDSSTVNKIYGRKCDIKLISQELYKSFVDHNHIQGYAPSTIMIGLFYNDDCVSVMGFNEPRKIFNDSLKYELELVRYCSKLNTSIIGGASKIFSFLLKNYSYSRIISYSDLRYSIGNVYLELGFKHLGDSKPGYFYFKPKNKIRESRYKFQKHKLVLQGFDKNKTEFEIMKELGYHRIFDCGQRKFLYER